MKVALLALSSIQLVAASPPPANSTTQGWLQKRRDVLGTIWANATLPPPSRNMPDWVFSTNASGLKRFVWDITGPAFNGSVHPMNATGYYHPIAAGQKSKHLVIVQHGHMWENWAVNTTTGTGCFRASPCLTTNGTCDLSCRFWDLNNVTTWVHQTLEMDYIMLYEPGMWPNHQSINYCDSPDGYCSTNHFYAWEALGDKPIRYFVEPTNLAVNYALSQGYEHVHLIGLSGGGWAAGVYAALDPRIGISVPLAGSLPWYLFKDHNPGDYEQKLHPQNPHYFLSQANFTELYLLAALEKGRVSQQILHENDPCCFHGRGRHAAILKYNAAVETALNATGTKHGYFSTAIVDWNKHEWDEKSKDICATALKAFDEDKIPPFNSYRCDILHNDEKTGSQCPWPDPGN